MAAPFAEIAHSGRPCSFPRWCRVAADDHTRDAEHAATAAMEMPERILRGIVPDQPPEARRVCGACKRKGR